MAAGKNRQVIEIDIASLSHDGRGVGRLDGKTVFVGGALPGERVRARIHRRHARFDEASVDSVLGASADRVEPPCPHFGRCGGCTLQHLGADAQLNAHQQNLESVLQRIAGITPRQWLAPVNSAPWDYRARARLAPTRDAAGGSLRLGFRREESRQVEPVTDCAVLEPALRALIGPLTAELDALGAPALLREILLAAGEPGVGIALDCATKASAAVRERMVAFAASQDCSLAWREPGSDWEPAAATLGYEPEPGLRLGFAPWHFTQANRAVNRALFAEVMRLLDPGPTDRVLDLFCGIGNFTLGLARRGGEVIGIDGGRAEIAQARTNASANACANVQFHQADLSGDTAGAPWARPRPDLVLLDPPRAGAAALIPNLLRLSPRRLCYVSCDPATFARDAAMLGKGGYALESVGALQMFPQTAHFETIGLFQR